MRLGERQLGDVRARVAKWASDLASRSTRTTVPESVRVAMNRFTEAVEEGVSSVEQLSVLAASALSQLDVAAPSDASRSVERVFLAHILPEWIRISESRDQQLPPSAQLQQLLVLVRSAAGTSKAHRQLTRSGPIWQALIKILASARWSLGQFDVEIGGIARRQLLGARVQDVLSLSRALLAEHGTFDRCLFMHLNGLRRNSLLLTEHQALISHARAALLLDQNPGLRGLAGVSWLHDPAIDAVSPHLAWTNRVFTEHDGFAWRGLKTDESSGALARSTERVRAHEAGTYHPRNGVVFWPRTPMLRWLNDFRPKLDEEDQAEFEELEQLVSGP